MTLSVNDGSGKKRRDLGLPDELSEKDWLHEDGVLTVRGRRRRFKENGVYQILQDSDRLLLIYLRDEGIHHIFRSYRASWLTAFTDSQLVGREVLLWRGSGPALSPEGRKDRDQDKQEVISL